jgi:hypothetical protein
MNGHRILYFACNLSKLNTVCTFQNSVQIGKNKYVVFIIIFNRNFAHNFV